MSLEDTIKELRAQKEAAEAREAEEAKVPEEVEVVEEPKEPEEEPKAEVKEEAKEEKKEELDDSGYARLRREAKAAEKRAEEAERRAAEAEKRAAAKIEEPEEETQVEIPPEVAEVVESHRRNKAMQEFQELEAPFRAKHPEYDDIAEQFLIAQAQSIKIQNPRMADHKVLEAAKETILRKAGKYLTDGFDPIEELYHEAMDLGLKPRAKAEAKEEEIKEEPKPDMDKVAANRKRSAGMNAASGKSEGQVTKQAAAQLSIAEWNKLPASEKKRLMYG